MIIIIKLVDQHLLQQMFNNVETHNAVSIFVQNKFELLFLFSKQLLGKGSFQISKPKEVILFRYIQKKT